jgi:hypothetical protein
MPCSNLFYAACHLCGYEMTRRDSPQVGAPPDVLERLTAMAAKLDARPPGRHEPRDPELDQFMVNLALNFRYNLQH